MYRLPTLSSLLHRASAACRSAQRNAIDLPRMLRNAIAPHSTPLQQPPCPASPRTVQQQQAVLFSRSAATPSSQSTPARFSVTAVAAVPEFCIQLEAALQRHSMQARGSRKQFHGAKLPAAHGIATPAAASLISHLSAVHAAASSCAILASHAALAPLSAVPGPSTSRTHLQREIHVCIAILCCCCLCISARASWLVHQCASGPPLQLYFPECDPSTSGTDPPGRVSHSRTTCLHRYMDVLDAASCAEVVVCSSFALRMQDSLFSDDATC